MFNGPKAVSLFVQTMEEYDDLVPTPDHEGKLELTYRGWNLVDECVWTMGRELLVLDISYNSITELPPELGDLMQLRELICGCNKLKEFPSQIGKLKHLKRIKADGNKLIRLPDELGDCERLTVLILSENKLQTIPSKLSQLQHLEELILANNQLKYFPPAMCLNPQLKNIDLLNNVGLSHMVPTKLQGNHEFIVWMCRKW
jgi:Leucine-rich repeat (LRR) protein